MTAKHPLVTFVASRVQAALAQHDARRVVMALSGGLDSCVLLHILATPSVLPEGTSLCALHINHHLQEAAALFASHSQTVCQQLTIPCQVIDVTVELADGLGVEGAARKARYGAFAQALQTKDLLIQAHHADDQMETFLLHLMRGSGINGLSGMPAERPCGKGNLYRPLLEVPLSELIAYAKTQRIRWVNDPTNDASEYDRNYLRHQVIPNLTSRWPHAYRSITQSLRHLSDANELLTSLANDDFAAVTITDAGNTKQLNLDKLRALPVPRQTMVLRAWLAQAGAPFPGRRRLMQALADFLTAGRDKCPELVWDGFRVDRYQNRLYLRHVSPATNSGDTQEIKNPTLCFAPGQRVDFKGIGSFELLAVQGRGIAAAALDELNLVLRFRQGGEKVKLAKNRPAQRLKEWFATQNIPPWERDSLPLLMCGNRVVCVADRLICYPFSEPVDDGQAGWLPVWRPFDLICASTPTSKA